MDPRHVYIIFYSMLSMCPKYFVPSGTGGLWLRQELELLSLSNPAWILPSRSVLAVGVCFQRELTQLSAVTLLNFTSSRQTGLMGRSTRCLQLPLCKTWAMFANEPKLS